MQLLISMPTYKILTLNKILIFFFPPNVDVLRNILGENVLNAVRLRFQLRNSNLEVQTLNLSTVQGKRTPSNDRLKFRLEII